jgi:aspartate/methionine/tyrosine aminotransferase
MRFAKNKADRGRYNFLRSGLSSPPPPLSFPEGTEFTDTRAPYGLPELIAAIANRYGVSEAEVFLASGTSGTNFFLAGVLLSPGDEVVVEKPTYEVLHLLSRVFGATPVRWDRPWENRFVADPDQLLPLLGPRTRAVFLTNPHNPSGTVLPPAVLDALVEITTDRGIHLVIDEVYLDAVPGATPVRRLGGLAVSTASLTKVYGMGPLRIGWALAPPDLVGALNRFHDLASVSCSFPAQILAHQAFAHLETWRRRAHGVFQKNFPRVDQWVEETEGLTWIPPGGVVFGFPRLTCGVNAWDLYALLEREYDTLISPGRFFDGFEEHFRIGFGEDGEAWVEGLSRIGEAIRRLA